MTTDPRGIYSRKSSQSTFTRRDLRQLAAVIDESKLLISVKKKKVKEVWELLRLSIVVLGPWGQI